MGLGSRVPGCVLRHKAMCFYKRTGRGLGLDFLALGLRIAFPSLSHVHASPMQNAKP